jgi:hypothetical protein
MENKLVKLDSPAQLQVFSNTLKSFIVKQGLFSKIKDKNYVNVEGWEFAGAATGLSPIVKNVINESNDKEIKYRAEVELVNNKGLIIGFGVAICSNKECSKKSFDEYAIASMAQTRAIGKAFRNKLAFLMKMAGYEPTPAEEVEMPEQKEANKETINEVVKGYKLMIDEANTEPKKRIVLRKITQGFENGVIDEKTFKELKTKNGLEE